MFQFLSGAWALLLGMLLLTLGNGVQSTLLGIRGEIEGFSTFEMSLVMSGYFLGFLGGSRMAPEMIRRVGHVRVFAALASFISAVIIIYPTFANPTVWFICRVLIGFCFSGVYVTAESWLNNAATNETRGQALSLYVIVQMIGVVTAQAILVTADPSGFVLFVIPSVLVSISFAPILLSISPTPAFEATKPMSLRELVNISPLGTVGMFLLGGVFAAQFGMAAVYAASIGLSVKDISLFVASFYVGGMIVQYPLGWMSDRMDRRVLILIAGLIGGIGAIVGMLLGTSYMMLLVAAVLVGGFSNPLYSLLIAHLNDYLEHEDMAAASGGMVFINGLGAIAGPVLTGWFMAVFGAPGYFLFLAILMLAIAAYAAFRMTRRAGIAVEDTSTYAPILPSSSPVAVEAAQEFAIETALEEEDAENTQ
ncbi:Predicted arabinose efflux permease, MFS family [Shimia gijangensis]|uniref:Predicted arabinose efflux permease, MFS family n=1 Tax=Shimia gijangensis TaxID=1470563 RepID=A0A1M6ELI1_9RHOB|nr:MFS transporter [Shimia gijangensis]SHI86385.1 Predicted arabinose efflux permease, MFS family [Shimia gijangensis]